MIKDILIEICCGSYEDCRTAHNNHVDRIELNSALELGGLTPSVATLRMTKELTDIPLCCMIRPRPSGFCYSEELYQIMLADARILLENKADGIVFGYLLSDNTIDVNRTKETTELIHSYGKEAIFHKAFDLCPDFDQASQILIDCGVDRVLTSCGPDIISGLPKLKELIERYGDKLAYLPGGGVTADNIRHILDASGSRQIHMTAKQSYDDNGAYVAVDDATLKKFLSKI